MFGKSHSNPSVMKHSFSQVPKADIQRSTFDRSHGHKTTFDSGYLIPLLLDEALPGDTYKVDMTAFARLATPIFPIMDNMYLDSQFFAVPIRLLWDNWEKFNGAQDNPGDSTDFTIPQMVSPVGGYLLNSLSDYMGIPTGVAGLTHSSLFHRAYNLIWNTWYRDQNMQDSVHMDKDDGPDLPADYVLLRRGKRHDYFTSALTRPQKGDAVELPLGTRAQIKTDLTAATPALTVLNGANAFAPMGTGGAQLVMAAAAGGVGDSLYADLSTAAAATINTIRNAVTVQQVFELDARGGTRYIELIKQHFGVTSPDARLQRPEYLGGGSTPVNISPIPQTGSTDATSPQGNLAAMGTALASGHGFTMSFTEHCLIIGIVSVRADLTYQQGLNRMFSRLTRFDFALPTLAHIGEQAVLQKEIFADGTANDDIVFGYQERFAEYRYKPSQITGLFRSNAAQSLDAWHLSQEFSGAPELDNDFIVEDPPVDRVIAVTDQPHFLLDSYFRMHCARPLPLFGVPGLLRF